MIDYYHWPRCGDYRFDEEYFPDPEAMVRELKEMGIETMVSIWPQIDWRSENYEEMKQQGLLVKANSGVDVQMVFHGNNVFLDATNPRTRKYVWEKIKRITRTWESKPSGWMRPSRNLPPMILRVTGTLHDRWRKWEIFIRESMPGCSTRDRRKTARKIS